MLITKKRVKKELFPSIIKGGRTISSPNFYIRFLEQKESKTSLFSFVVPNKVVKTSVGRHKLKRKMSAVVEKNFKIIKNNLICLVFAKKNPPKLIYLEIETELLSLFSQI
jgi:ribonuclease P protein component